MLSTPRAASAQTDYPALFDATWNAVNEHFYDPSFRGHDWRVIGAQYRQAGRGEN
jgi:Tricorn protease C1 domain